MTGCRDMDKKHQKYPKNGGFPPFVTPKIVSKIGHCHFCTLMVPELHAKFQKKLMSSSILVLSKSVSEHKKQFHESFSF